LEKDDGQDIHTFQRLTLYLVEASEGNVFFERSLTWFMESF
jgi:hypothetical protein